MRQKKKELLFGTYQRKAEHFRYGTKLISYDTFKISEAELTQDPEYPIKKEKRKKINYISNFTKSMQQYTSAVKTAIIRN